MKQKSIFGVAQECVFFFSDFYMLDAGAAAGMSIL